MSEDDLTHTEQAMLYYGGDLSPAEAAEFEKHLAGCDECQAMLAKAKEYLPVAEKLLAFQPKYTIDEQVARFEQMRKAHDRRRWLKRIGIGIGLLAIAVGIAWTLMHQKPAPPPAPPDAGAPERPLPISAPEP